MSPDPYSLEDDATIADEAHLWRNIPPWHIIDDKNTGALSISKAAFENHPDGTPMSVVLGDDVLAAGRDPTSLLDHLPTGFCLASITAGFARTLGRGIARRPLPEEPAHAEVFGTKTDSVRKKLARSATWVIAPKTGTE